jgi:hypothetical protein
MPAGVLIAAYRCGLTGAPKRRTYLPQAHRATDFQTAGEPPPDQGQEFHPNPNLPSTGHQRNFDQSENPPAPSQQRPNDLKVLKRGIAITNCCGFTASRRTPLLPQAHRAISLITAYCCGTYRRSEETHLLPQAHRVIDFKLARPSPTKDLQNSIPISTLSLANLSSPPTGPY